MATKTITLTQAACERLKKQKTPSENFSDVVLREIPVACGTAGEILDYFETRPLPKANPRTRAEMITGRGRRSNCKLRSTR